MTDADLYARGVATLLAAWDAYARGAAGASVERLNGVTAAVFPSGPERDVYNNAVLERDLSPLARPVAVDEMQAAYRAAGVGLYAAWVHEADAEMRAELIGRGYVLNETTRAMGMNAGPVAAGRAPSGVELGPIDWSEYLAFLYLDVPAGLLGGADPNVFHAVGARIDGEMVATAMAFDHDGDRGIYNVSTLDAARKRGIGTALTALLVRDGFERGCTTATLQSTPMAERIYAAVGFRDLGCFLEFVPAPEA